MGFDMDSFNEITGSILLFCLVFGMSATVDIEALKVQLTNRKAILTGLGLLFIIMPLLGFIVVNCFKLDHPTGVMLLVVTSSPGGSFSNWWCSMFNADLALSVTMTAISTLLSTVMLPLNLLIYARFSYNDDVVDTLNWSSVMLALAIVIAAIALGLWASAAVHSHKFNMQVNRLGNVSGIALIIFSAIMSNSDENSRVWSREWTFYFGVATPCIVGLLIANLTAAAVRLLKPERVTVSVECSCQNVGIATSVALSMFYGENLARAIAVPFYYGMVEGFCMIIYCFSAWKAGWTKAPPNVPVWKMLYDSYEILNLEAKAPDGSTDMVIEDGLPYVSEEDDDRLDTDYCYVQHGDAATEEASSPSGTPTAVKTTTTAQQKAVPSSPIPS